MAKNEKGVAIVVKAWLPVGETIEEVSAALTKVTTAHVTGDYAGLIGKAKVDEVKTDLKTRRVEDAPEPVAESVPDDDGEEGEPQNED